MRQVEGGQVCSGAERELAEVWNPERRRDVERALRATGASHAGSTWSRLATALDGYAETWREHYVEACRATQRGEQSPTHMDVQMACLKRHRVAFATAVDILAAADRGVLDRALEIVEELPALARCSDSETLAAAPSLPVDPGAARAVARAREILAGAAILYSAGDYPGTLTSVHAAEGELAGVGHEPTLAEAEWLRGRGSLGLLRLEDAEVAHLRSLTLALRSGAPRIAAAAAHGLAYLGYRRARYDEALRMSRLAESLARGSGDGERLAQVLQIRAAILAGQDDSDDARNYARRAVEMLEELLGPEHRVVARARDTLATLLAGDAAVAQHRRALAIWERAVGRDHPETAMFLNNLATALHGSGAKSEAVELMRRALAIREEAFGPEHVRVAATRLNLGTALVRVGYHDEGRVQLRKALALFRRLHDDAHPVVVTARLNLGAALLALGQATEAEREFAAALAGRRRALGDLHPKVASIKAKLAEAHATAERFRASAPSHSHDPPNEP